MKKILLIMVLMFAMVGISMAQTHHQHKKHVYHKLHHHHPKHHHVKR